MPLYRGLGRGSSPATPAEERTRLIVRPGVNPTGAEAIPATATPVAPAPEEPGGGAVPPVVDPTRRIVRPESRVRKDTATPAPVTGSHEAAAASEPVVARTLTRDPLANPVVGWLVIIAGPGRGEILPLSYGVNDIGRSPGARIRLDFGDPAIAWNNQAAVIYTARSRRFYLQSLAAGICLNGRPIQDSTELAGGETLQLGQTELRFVPLCGLDFDWRNSR